MTLIVALEGKEGLLLAADSRGTIGDPRGLTAINDAHKKLFKLSNYCGIGVSGSSELAAKLMDELITILQEKKIEYVDPCLDKTREVIRNRYNDWFKQFSLDSRPAVILTLAGFNKTEKEHVPRIYLLSSQLDFAPQLCPSGYMLSGIPQYATYLLHRLYDRQMNMENLASLAVYLIAETATQDPKVGGPIKIAQITMSTGYFELDDSKIQEIKARNEEQNQKLKRFFFTGGK